MRVLPGHWKLSVIERCRYKEVGLSLSRKGVCAYMKTTRQAWQSVRTGKKLLGESGGILSPPGSPRKVYKLGSWKCLFWLSRIFSKQIRRKLQYQSLLLSVKYSDNGEKRVNNDALKKITKDKGETSNLQTSKLCYNAVSINAFVLVHLQHCKWAQTLVFHRH